MRPHVLLRVHQHAPAHKEQLPFVRGVPGPGPHTPKLLAGQGGSRLGLGCSTSSACITAHQIWQGTRVPHAAHTSTHTAPSTHTHTHTQHTTHAHTHTTHSTNITHAHAHTQHTRTRHTQPQILKLAAASASSLERPSLHQQVQRFLRTMPAAGSIADLGEQPRVAGAAAAAACARALPGDGRALWLAA